MNKILAKTMVKYRNGLSLAGYRIGTSENEGNFPLIAAVAADLSQLGYALSGDIIKSLKRMSTAAIKDFHGKSVSLIKEMLGADVKYAPLFRKFPDEIPNRSVYVSSYYAVVGAYAYLLDYEIYGYWSSDEYNGSWFGRQFPGVTLEEAITRPSLVSTKPLKVLSILDESALADIFTNLVSAKGSISESDKAFVAEYVREFATSDGVPTPDEIPNKENLTYYIGVVAKEVGMSVVNDTFLRYMKTATDVLRTATAFSGSDVALAEHTRFKLSNSQRKFILSALEALNYDSATEDMMRFRGLWLVLAKYLHVNAYADKYPNATKMVFSLRNESEIIPTFNRAIEHALLWKNLNDKMELAAFLSLVSSRPGDFARRLDHILRLTTFKAQTVYAFLTVADKVSTPLLLNLATHMYHRDHKAGVRVFMPKGSTTNATVVNGDDRSLLPTDIAHQISAGISEILTNRFAGKPSLGKVYIDPALGDILVPTSMRNASESLMTVARGSKLRLPDDAKVFRLFLYWEDQKDGGYNSRVDVDLSVAMLTEDFKSNGVVSYYSLSGKGITHSGDFTSAPNGAAEFIDVNIDEVLKAVNSNSTSGYHSAHYGVKPKKTRYIAVTVNSYSGQAFNTFTAKAGYMVRDGKTGKSFEAKAVEQKYDVTAGTKFAVPMLLDLVERKVIWLDAGLKDANVATNIGHKGADLGILAKYAAEMYREKANLLDLLLLHTKTRAESVSFDFDPEVKYDTVLDMKFAARVDEIMSDWIG